ncbi:MAG: cytochrome c oxidase subunit II [Burkholderiales bacterium]|nr:cytochrome c oxidase subunit II [Burkholderiales bacterium]
MGMGTLAALMSMAAWAEESKYNLPTPQSEVAQEIFDLHILIMWVCVGIFVVVFGAMFYSIWKHRKSAGHKAAHFHENTTVEVIWTIIPFIILTAMAIPSTKVILNMRDASNPDITIKVTGYQWKWEYDYRTEGIKFLSMLSTPRDQIEGSAKKGENYLLEVDNAMVVPVGKKIRLLLTANDVIHAWWVPAFGIKQDAIPGYIKDAWFIAKTPGTFRGQCAELCGKDHGFMPIVVEVKSVDDYAKWVADQKAKTAAITLDPNKTYSAGELKAQGEKVYAANCAACHQANGAGLPPAFPAITGSKIATGDKAAHIAIVMNGKPGTAMAAFGKQLNDVDLAAVVSYERNALGNKTGDLVQPADIKALRK